MSKKGPDHSFRELRLLSILHHGRLMTHRMGGGFFAPILDVCG